MTTEDLTGLQEQIRESREAGRISAAEEQAIQDITSMRGNEAGLRVLQYFEKMNYIRPYFENRGGSFIIHEFLYNPNSSGAERPRMILALKEALAILELHQRMGGYYR